MSTIETNHRQTETITVTNTTNSDEESGNMEASNVTTTTTTVRKRTRATAEQLSVLEDTFAANVSPNSKLRKELSERLQMSERSIQIWFQNRRAKVKHVQKRAQMQMQQASIRAQLYHYHQQQHYGMQPYGGTTTPIMPLPQQQHMYAPRVPLPPSSNVDYHHHHSLPTPPASSASPVASLDPSIPPTHHLSSYPSQNTMEFPDYLQGTGAAATGGPLSPSLSPHQVHPPPVESPTNASSTSASSMPSLIAVPDAGPTAMLATTSSTSVSSSITDHLASTPATPPASIGDQTTVSPQDIWPASVHQAEHMMRSQSVSISSSLPTGNGPCSSDLSAATSYPLERSLSNPPMTTIDPSNLMMNANSNDPSTEQQLAHAPLTSSPSPLPLATTTTTTTTTAADIFLNCTTLTIGTWHRLKLRASDLLCTFKNSHSNNNNKPTFEWQIEDAGCHFKMEIPLSSIASIDMVQDSTAHGFADVHFDISESPLFYMETATSSSDNRWIQCSDFTEGKQASRFFRHSLKGMTAHLKHDLMTLMDQCPESRRWIRFLDLPPPPPHHHQPSSMSYPPPQYQQQQYYAAPGHQHPYSADASFMVTGTGSDFGGTYPTNDQAFSSMYMPPPPPPPPNASAASYWYQAPPPSSQMTGMAPLV